MSRSFRERLVALEYALEFPQRVLVFRDGNVTKEQLREDIERWKLGAPLEKVKINDNYKGGEVEFSYIVFVKPRKKIDEEPNQLEPDVSKQRC